MFRHAKPIILTALLMLVLSYFYFDRPLVAWAAHLPPWVSKGAKLLSWTIDPNVQLLLWPIIFYLYTFAYGKSTFRKEILFILVAIPVAILSIDIVKFLLGRARPELWLSQNIYGFYGWGMSKKFLSFPSGHASAIGGLMGALACFRPRLTWAFLLIAVALSFLRVLALEHYFSDTWCGAFLAFYIVQGLYPQYLQTLRRNLLWKIF